MKTNVLFNADEFLKEVNGLALNYERSVMYIHKQAITATIPSAIDYVSDKYAINFRHCESPFTRIELGFSLDTEILRKHKPGILHLYEHMLFHLLPDHTMSDISERYNKIFATQNAYTDYDCIKITSTVPTEYTGLALNLMHDLVNKTSLEKVTEFLENEKKVVIEEIEGRNSDLWCHFLDILPDIYEFGYNSTTGNVSDIESVTPEDIQNLQKDIFKYGRFSITAMGNELAHRFIKVFTLYKSITDSDMCFTQEEVNKLDDALSEAYKILKYKWPLGNSPIITNFQPRKMQFQNNFINTTEDGFIKSFEAVKNRMTLIDPNAAPIYQIIKVLPMDISPLINEAYYAKDFNEYLKHVWIPVAPVVSALNGMETSMFKEIRLSGLAYATGVFFVNYFNSICMIFYTETSDINNADKIFDIYEKVIRTIDLEYTPEKHYQRTYKLEYNKLRNAESVDILFGLFSKESNHILMESRLLSYVDYSREEVLAAFNRFVYNNKLERDFIIGGMKNEQE